MRSAFVLRSPRTTKRAAEIELSVLMSSNEVSTIGFFIPVIFIILSLDILFPYYFTSRRCLPFADQMKLSSVKKIIPAYFASGV